MAHTNTPEKFEVGQEIVKVGGKYDLGQHYIYFGLTVRGSEHVSSYGGREILVIEVGQPHLATGTVLCSEDILCEAVK
jgi:hypothetical protein